ncbi:unnamed protein product, partial [Prorocentrum cordatum]
AASMAAINDVATWAGLVGEGPTSAKGSLYTLLGITGAEHPRVLGGIPMADFDAIIDRWVIENRDEGLRKVKMSIVIDQSDDSEVEVLDSIKVAEAYARYHARIGAFPPADEELSAEQLSCLHSLLENGRPPYTDMAVWGPSYHRLQKKIRLKGSRLHPSGTITPVELYGPCDYETWAECYAAFKTGALMFNQLTPARLDAYEKHIRHYHERYGRDQWAIIYQADVRARLELSERLRRRGQEEASRAAATGKLHDFDPRAPWEWVWKHLVEESSFWHREVEGPCLLVLAKTKSLGTMLENDAPVEGHRGSGASGQSQGANKRKSKAPSQRDSATPPPEKVHRVDEQGRYTHNRKGAKLCADFQSGRCQDGPITGVCPLQPGHRHQCNRCLLPKHGGEACKSGAKGGGRGDSCSNVKRRRLARPVGAESLSGALGVCAPTSIDALPYAQHDFLHLPSGLARGQRHLHVFSGRRGRAGSFGEAVRSMGGECVEVDVCNGPDFDLLNEDIFGAVVSQIRSGEYRGILLEPPAFTKTATLRTGSGAERYGRKHLKPSETKQVKEGTLLALRSLSVMEEAATVECPAILVQPLLEDDPEAISMLKLDEFVDFREREPTCMLTHSARPSADGARGDRMMSLLTTRVDCSDLSPRSLPRAGREEHSRQAAAAQADAVGLNKYFAVKLCLGAGVPAPAAAQAASPAAFARTGYWGNCLIRLERGAGSKTEQMDSITVKPCIDFRHSLKGPRKLTMGHSKEEDNQKYVGGMRHPRRSPEFMKNYGTVSLIIRRKIDDYLNDHPVAERQCLEALGSEDLGAGPDENHQREIRNIIGACVHEANHEPVQGEHCQSSIRVDIQDPGIFPPVHGPDDRDEGDLTETPDAELRNYTSVDGDPHADPEVERLKASGFVKTFHSREAVEKYLGGPPQVSKLGMITKVTKAGKTKRRLILDCRESGVNARVKQRQRIVLPRLTDVIDDAMFLAQRAEQHPEMEVEWMILDFTDWFFHVPLRPCERKYFVAHHKGCYLVFVTMAQGSCNAPLVCGRVAAMLARLTQSMFSPEECRQQLYVGDPCTTAVGTRPQRDRMFATIIIVWAALGIGLAYRKASRGHSVEWIGARLTVEDTPTEQRPGAQRRKQVRATAKQEIFDDVAELISSFRQRNVIPIKEALAFVGKANHIAGIVEAWRPFLQDVWGAIASNRSGAASNAPARCVWRKQIEHVLEWLSAFYAGSAGALCRVHRVDAYFGRGCQVVITTDASPWGLGGYLKIGNAILEYFSSPLTEEDEKQLDTPRGDAAGQQVWEALAMLQALRLWREFWLSEGVTLAATSDSVSTLTVIMKLRSRAGAAGLGQIARELALDFGDCAYKPRVLEHLPGIANDTADELSRRAQPGHRLKALAVLSGATERHPLRGSTFWKATAAAARSGIGGAEGQQ